LAGLAGIVCGLVAAQGVDAPEAVAPFIQKNGVIMTVVHYLAFALFALVAVTVIKAPAGKKYGRAILGVAVTVVICAGTQIYLIATQ